jgi:hypothetical protein
VNGVRYRTHRKIISSKKRGFNEGGDGEKQMNPFSSVGLMRKGKTIFGSEKFLKNRFMKTLDRPTRDR